MKLDHGFRMSRRVGVQTADEVELIDMPRNMGIKLRDPRAGLAVLAELELRTGKDSTARSDLAIILLELRLVIPGVHLGRCAIHEEEDDSPGFHRPMWPFRRERTGLGPLVSRAFDALSRVLPEHAGQRR